ncbi:MAG: dienelactone hydrolase family protein [Fimbriimonadaceae bacterium]|nr:dienelactone hydrolase family protein [Fimbriimonadaceae bacterium]
MTAIALLTTMALQPALLEETVLYKDASGAECQGTWVRPANRSNVPAVIIVHDWNGPDDYELMRARMVATEWGIGAFVADIYAKARPTDTAGNRAEATKYYGDNALFRTRLQGAIDAVKARGDVQKTNVAAMGYCFGGTAVLEMARMNADVVAVTSFHGGLSTANPAPGEIKPKILLNHAADDPSVPKEMLVGFLEEMTKAKADYRMVIYNVAAHPFTVVGGSGYNEAADKRSWAATTEFFREVGVISGS